MWIFRHLQVCDFVGYWKKGVCTGYASAPSSDLFGLALVVTSLPPSQRRPPPPPNTRRIWNYWYGVCRRLCQILKRQWRSAAAYLLSNSTDQRPMARIRVVTIISKYFTVIFGLFVLVVRTWSN